MTLSSWPFVLPPKTGSQEVRQCCSRLLRVFRSDYNPAGTDISDRRSTSHQIQSTMPHQLSHRAAQLPPGEIARFEVNPAIPA